MADLAHDASGPTSSEPAGIAVREADRPASSDKGKLRVFISYSRDDLDFADQRDDALNACGFKCLIDRHGISGGEDWKRRLATPRALAAARAAFVRALIIARSFLASAANRCRMNGSTSGPNSATTNGTL